MDLWQDILNTALLGTDKRSPATEGLPADLQEAAALITQNKASDKEEQFLQLAALVFNYRQCGVAPLQKESVGIEAAPAEERPYCSAHSMQVLKDILDTESIPLLGLWLEQCARKEQLIQPDLLPVVLTLGMQYKKLQPLLGDCCGKRGAWLRGFNPDWKFSIATTNEELWQTGTLEQRKAVLQELRAAQPEQAREWLLQIWAQEDANTRTELLGVLSINISEADIGFLEMLSTDKSKKVKELALQLLKQIPTSAIVQQYQGVLHQAVTLKTEKGLLGLSKKTSLEIELPTGIDESIFKTGVDKLSNNKELTDDEFIVYQLAQVTPLSFWEQQLNSDPEGVIELLQKDKKGKKLLSALIHAVVLRADARWAMAFMKQSETFYLDILPLLPVDKQEFHSQRFFAQHADSIIDYAVKRTDQWSMSFTELVFQHTAKHPYQYNRQFYHQHIERFPASITDGLHKYAPTEEGYKTMWGNTSSYIIKLMGLKTQLFQSFNAIK